MLRVAVSVEGPTEREFCREVLAPHFRTMDIFLEPKVVVTKHVISGPNHKGGAISLDRIFNEVRPLLHSFDHVTTFYDFYGFKDRAVGEIPEQLCARIAERLETPRHFTPYVQVYEFEALTFAAPENAGRLFQSPALTTAMRSAVESCGSPEQVNDSPETAPSKRLTAAFSQYLNQRYEKTFHGPLIAVDIGLAKIRQTCPRFRSWIEGIESLGAR